MKKQVEQTEKANLIRIDRLEQELLKQKKYRQCLSKNVYDL